MDPSRSSNRRLASAVFYGGCDSVRNLAHLLTGVFRKRRLALVTSVLLCTAIVVGAIFLWTIPAPAEAVPNDQQPVDLSGSAKTQVDSLTGAAEQVQAQIDALDVELERFTETYNELQVRLDEVNVQMAGLRRELTAAQAEHAYRVRKYEERLCELYKSGGRDQVLEFLLAADGIGDFINRVRLVVQLADQDRRVVDRLDDSTERLNVLLAEIDETKREQLDIRNEIGDQRKTIEIALADRESALADIDAEIRAVIDQERKRQEQERERLQQYVAGLINSGQFYAGPLPETDSQILNQVIETAAFYIGIPYVWAGDRPSTGFDCSGFTQFVYMQHGVYLPHYSGYQAQMGIPVSPEQIQPADLLAFGLPVHHVGIYIGQGYFIHAPRTGDVIRISHLSEKNNLAAIRRFPLQPRNGAPAVW